MYNLFYSIMRLYRFLIILFLIFSLTAYGKSNENTVTISGHYYGKNLIVKNPFAASGIGFSIYNGASKQYIDIRPNKL